MLLPECSTERLSVLAHDPEPDLAISPEARSRIHLASRYVPPQLLEAAYVTWARQSATPVSNASVSVESGLQDFVSLAMHAAAKAADSLYATLHALAIEAIVALRGLGISGRTLPTAGAAFAQRLGADAPSDLRARVGFVAERLVPPSTWTTLIEFAEGQCVQPKKGDHVSDH